MYVAHKERNGSAVGLAEYSHLWYLTQFLHGITGEHLLVCCNLLNTYAVYPFERFAQRNSSHIVGGTCLKFIRQFVVCGLFETNGLYHFATAVVWLHSVQPFLLAVKHAYACGGIHFVPAHYKEIGIQQLYIYFYVWSALCTIYKHRYIMVVRYLYALLHRVGYTHYVRYVCYAHQFGVLVEKGFVCLHIELFVACEGYHAQYNAYAVAQHLPGHNVAVMLHSGYYHLVALLQECVAK